MHPTTLFRFISHGLNFRALGRVDCSSWISWSCYLLGFMLALSPSSAAELRSGGTGAWALGGSVLVFFLIAIMIQRHMKLSLRASSFGDPTRLVTDGVFRYSRNPIYVAFLVPLLALGYFSIAAAVLSSLVYLISMTFLVIRREERVLQTQFGQEYSDYRASVPRWFAFI